jgi:O-antigen/teichoic acid export membrane protein
MNNVNNLKKSFLSNIFWSASEAFSNPIVMFILSPILLSNIGIENYGVFIFVITLSAFFSFSGLGMNTLVTYEIARKFSSYNFLELRKIFSVAIILSLTGVLFFSVLLLFVGYAIFLNVIPDYLNWNLNSRFIPIVILILIFSQIDSILSASLKGLHQFRLSSILELFTRFINLAIISLTALLFKDIYFILLSLVISSFISVTIKYIILRNFIKFIFIDIKTLKKIGMKLFEHSKWVALQNFAGTSYASLDKLIVGFFLGASELGVYAIFIMLAQLIHFIPASMLSFIFPKIARQDRNISMSNFKKLNFVSLLISLTISSLLIIFKPVIFHHFMINIDYTSIYYLILLCFFLLSLGIQSFYIALAMGKSRYISLVSFFAAILGIFCMIYFIKSYGIFSAIASRFIYSILTLMYMYPVLRKINK